LIKKFFMASVIAILFVAAAPLAVYAQSAIRSLSIDRTTINPGESITFTVRTTPQATHVFATVDGNRVQGVRVNATQHDWTITAWPTRTSTVTIFANNSENTSTAASLIIPITVTGTSSTTPPVIQTPQTPQTPAHNVVIPPAPPNLGPVSIASITETPATTAGHVQLTVVTGSETNDVWVNFDRVNNARSTGRFARGTMVSQTGNSRTWVVNFQPAAWATQQVEIGSNRTYNWPGAATQLHTLTLSQPFVPSANPAIQNVTLSNRNVNSGGSTTFTIRTNVDVEHVWVRDVDGREHTANRTNTSATNRTWSVSFSPGRTGTVTVFANATRNEAGAATRNESINVGSAFNATIVGTPTAVRLEGNNTRINVTTNNHTETVWVVMPGSSTRHQLNRTNSGSGDRTWSIELWDSLNSGDIVVHVSNATGNINNLTADNTRAITRGNVSGTGHIISVNHWNNSSRNASRGGHTLFRVVTSPSVDRLEVRSSNHGRVEVIERQSTHNNEREWYVEMSISNSAPVGGQVTFTVEAFVGSSRVDTRDLPATSITH
jgi:hypothetical protein